MQTSPSNFVKRTILCWLCSAVPLFAGTSWPNVDYKEVRAYAWHNPMKWLTPLENLTKGSCRMLSIATLFAGIPNPVAPSEETTVFHWVKAFFPWEELIRDDMTFAAGVINKDGALLNEKQVQRLLKAESRRFQKRGVAGCYFPHNAFVFYDAKGKPVAFLEICFDCMGARAIPEDQGFDPDYPTLAVICNELKLPLGWENKSVKQVQERFGWLTHSVKMPSSRKK